MNALHSLSLSSDRLLLCACALLLLIPHTQVCGTPDYFAPELVEIAQRPEMDGGSFKAMGEESGPQHNQQHSSLLLSLASHLTSLSNHSQAPAVTALLSTAGRSAA